MSNFAPRPAVGHMPFPGHRTCAEWDKPAFPHNAKPKRDEVPPGDTEAHRLARCAQIDLPLAQVVSLYALVADLRVSVVRSREQTDRLMIVRRSITREALRLGYGYPEIGRALNRDHSTIVQMMKGPKA